MELRDQRVSQNEISRTRHISPRSVGDVCRSAREQNIVHADIAELNDDEAYRLFFPEQTVSESVFAEPDYEWVHKEYAKRGVTLSMLHAEYREQCERDKTFACGTTKFNEGYRAYATAKNITRNYTHKAAERAEVDWAGTVFRPALATGEQVKIYFFLGVLPYSQYAYVEPTLDMKERT